MLQQIKQVGITYVTQRYLWWGLALVGLMVGPQIFIAMGSRRSAMDAAPAMVMLLGMPMLFALPFLVGQAKSQFAHSRARLTPNFVPAHLIVLVGVLVSFVVLYPLLFAALTQFQPLGLVALAVAIGAPAIWGAHFNRIAPILVSLVVFYSLLTDWGLRWWIVEASAHQAEHALILVAGFSLIVAWLWRLSHLAEEMDDYQNNFQWLMARRTGSEVVEQRRLIASHFRRNHLASWIGDWWHDRLGGYYGGSKTRLVRLLRYGFSANPVEVQALFMGAMFLAMAIFFSRFSIIAKGPASVGGLGFFVIFAILLPGQMAGELMAHRRPRIAFEMLLPLTRSRLINGLFAAAARDAVVMWLMMNTTLAIAIASAGDQISLRTVAMFLLLSGSMMFAAMGVSLRTSVWPSMAKRFAVLWVSWMVFMAPMIVWWNFREKIGDAPFNLVAIALIAAAAWLTRSARRAWLNLEFV